MNQPTEEMNFNVNESKTICIILNKCKNEDLHNIAKEIQSSKKYLKGYTQVFTSEDGENTKKYFSGLKNIAQSFSQTFSDSVDETSNIARSANTGALLASYLKGLNFLAHIFVALTIIKDENYKQNLSNYMQHNQMQIMGDVVWLGVLIASTLNLYDQNLNVQSFYNSALSVPILSAVALIGVAFDCYKNYAELRELRSTWQKFIETEQYKGLSEEAKKQAENAYKDLEKDKIAEFQYSRAIFATVFSYSSLSTLSYALQVAASSNVSQTFATALPHVQIAVSGMFIFYHMYNATREYWDKDFENKSPDERKKIKQDAIFNGMKELIKVAALLTIVLVLGANFHSLGGLLLIGALVVASNLIINKVVDYLKSNLEQSQKLKQDKGQHNFKDKLQKQEIELTGTNSLEQSQPLKQDKDQHNFKDKLQEQEIELTGINSQVYSVTNESQLKSKKEEQKDNKKTKETPVNTV